MLSVTHLSGFGAGGIATTGALIDRTAGTAIGNTTDNGGLAATFDGTTSQANAACSTRITQTTAFVGKDYGAARVISAAKAFGSNAAGYVNTTNPGTTIQLRADSSSPTNGTEGVLLGSITFTDTANESTGRDIPAASPDLYRYVWLYITHDGAASNIFVAEVQFFE